MNKSVELPQFEAPASWGEPVPPTPRPQPVRTIDWDLRDTHFTRPPKNAEAADETTLLTRFRTELTWAPDSLSEDVIRNGYLIAREIGDSAIAEADTDTISSAFSILEQARHTSKPKWFSRIEGNSANHEESSGGGYLRVGDVFFGDTTDAEQSLKESGVDLLHPADARLFRFMQGVAHEAGHAIMAGIGDQLDRSVEQADPDTRVTELATRAYLSRHPEQGFTGDWETDVNIHDERWSEGYKRLVIHKSAQHLGYDDEAANKIADVFGYTPNTHAAEGHSQLDYLDQVAENLVANRAVPIGSLLPEHAHWQDKNSGDLGYNLPLSPQQIVAQLRELSAMLKDKNRDYTPVSAEPPQPEGWNAAVHQNQELAIKDYLKGMRKRRAEVLKSKSPEASTFGFRRKLSKFAGNLSLRGIVSHFKGRES